MKILKVFSALIMAVIMDTSYAQFLFQPPVSYAISDQPTNVCAGDFNNDGKVDIAASNRYHNSVSVLLGNGNGQLNLSAIYSVGTYPQNVSTADLNGDGNADLVTANPQSHNFSILFGAGNGNFTSAVHYPCGSFPMGVACADFNSDGKNDVVLSLSGEGSVEYFTGNGNGTFQSSSKYTTGGDAPNTMEQGDFNNDGKLDVIVGNMNSSSLAVLLNNGTGGFSSPILTTSMSPGSIFVSTAFDIDSDGFCDAIESSVIGGPWVFRSNGTGGLTLFAGLNEGFDAHRSHCVADFDQDGFNDVAGCGADVSPKITICAGDTGAANFFNYQAFTITGGSPWPSHVIACDLNGDGAQDIVAADILNSSVVVFLNNIPTRMSETEIAYTMLVYPNPASERLFFHKSNTKTKQLINFAGQIIRSTESSTMDIHNVPEGMYVLLCGKFSQPITIE